MTTTPGCTGDERPGRLDPVHLGHVDVHQDEGGLELLCQRDRLASVGRLADQLELGRPAEDGLHGRPERGLIVHDQDRKAFTHFSIFARAGTGDPGGATRRVVVVSPSPGSLR